MRPRDHDIERVDIGADEAGTPSLPEYGLEFLGNGLPGLRVRVQFAAPVETPHDSGGKPHSYLQYKVVGLAKSA